MAQMNKEEVFESKTIGDVAVEIVGKCEVLRDILYMMADATSRGDIASALSLEFIAMQIEECKQKLLPLSDSSESVA